jgi:hypothetical protein
MQTETKEESQEMPSGPGGRSAVPCSLTLLQECHFILKAMQGEIRTNASKPARKLLKEETWKRQIAQRIEERSAAQKQRLEDYLAKLKSKENAEVSQL